MITPYAFARMAMTLILIITVRWSTLILRDSNWKNYKILNIFEQVILLYILTSASAY